MNAHGQASLFPSCVWFVLRGEEHVRCENDRVLPSESCAEHLETCAGIVGRVCVVEGCSGESWTDSVVYCAAHENAEDRVEHERLKAQAQRKARRVA